MRVKVIAPDGRLIPGVGVKAFGEYFELEQAAAESYARAYPDAFAVEPVTEKKPARKGESNGS
jgi:hypothetical protein